MNDIFLSYSSKDRERVQQLRDALVDRGLTVFWDLEVPAGIDWDTWIRQQLNESGCAVVVWSLNSVGSDNVRHEAVIAKKQGKIVPVLFNALDADKFPMGFHAMQAANLASWTGDPADSEWQKLVAQLELKLTPAWIKRNLDALDAELVGERSRRETAERRDRALRDQIAREAEARQQLRSELDQALERIEHLTANVQTSDAERSGNSAKIAELRAQLKSAEEQRKSLEQRCLDAESRAAQLTHLTAGPTPQRSSRSIEPAAHREVAVGVLSVLSGPGDVERTEPPPDEGRYAYIALGIVLLGIILIGSIVSALYSF